MARLEDVPLKFAVQSRKGRYGIDGTAMLMNAFVEEAGEEGKTPLPIYCVDGLRPYSEFGSGPIRGIFPAGSFLYVVSGNLVGRMTEGSAVQEIGAIPAAGGVWMDRNRRTEQPQVALSAGGVGYLLVEDQVIQIMDEDFPPSVGPVSYIDGYFAWVANDQSAGRYIISAVDDGGDYSALDIGSTESLPDRLVASLRRRGELWLPGEKSVEVHANSGNNLFPFERIPGVSIDKGCVSPATARVVDEDVVWVADDCTVRRGVNYRAVRISHHDVERSIEALKDKSTLSALVIEKGGHSFYELSSPSFTWRLDLTTNKWHELRSVGRDRWRASCSCRFGNHVVIGDAFSGKLYTLDADYQKDGTDPLIWKIRSPISHDFPNSIQWKELAFDVNTGVGDSQAEDEAKDPHLMLRYSDDGGRTWSNEYRGSVGRQGITGTQLVFDDLGQSSGSGRTWELSISAAVARCLLGVKAKIRRVSR